MMTATVNFHPGLAMLTVVCKRRRSKLLVLISGVATIFTLPIAIPILEYLGTELSVYVYT